MIRWEKLFEYIFFEVSGEVGDGDAVVFLKKSDAKVVAEYFQKWLNKKEHYNHILSEVGGFWNVSDQRNENYIFTNNPYVGNEPQWFTVVIQAW